MLVPKAVGTATYAAVFAKLSSVFAKEGAINKESINSWKRQAEVAQIIAEVIVTQILATGQVAPGIVTAGSPASHISSTPGKII